ncbi:unnamed protein product [Paramecium sonneborni]|uniref:HMG box domain-containing protein n=1 Tax=Paramecium sonneborni TaxID=65129 RepID=A0A8S1QZ59_9CILI|nr:unnamed protein product [Paramecium sonneborni]
MVNQLPQRQFISAYQIFYKEQAQILMQNGVGINMVGSLLQTKWEQLTQDKQRHYQELFENFEVKYLEQLNEFKKLNRMLKYSKKIEKQIIKPRKPQIPQINYVIENRYKYNRKLYSQTQIYIELIQEFGIQRQEVKEQLELEYETKQIIYNDEMMKLLKHNCQKYQDLKEKLQKNLQQEMKVIESNYNEQEKEKFAVEIQSDKHIMKRKVSLSGNKYKEVYINKSGISIKELSLNTLEEPQQRKTVL